ncbi:MAG: PD-(D/E)XK nuclease domain-containing protein [Thermodesulfobacteriota bacterium]|nr:PD-(D/E)XK nuclease domain-containing protein [Thermodesulfobacteriota bacterium]
MTSPSVYCCFATLGLDVTPELSTGKGRIDLVLRFADRIYLIEFKVVELTGSGRALEQILKKGYAEQFVSRSPDGTFCPVYLIGVAFSSREKNIAAVEWQKLDSE